MERKTKKTMDKLYIIIPAYNESENLKNLVSDWYPIVERYNGNGESRMIVINDGSTDNTYRILQEYEKTHPLLIALTKKNGGHGSTLLFGYSYAIGQGADYIFQTDSDGQTNPEEFAQFWNERNEYDAIIGNRIVRGDGKSRKFVENTVCMLLRVIFGIRVEDANAPFRLMKTSLVKKYIDRLPKDYNLPNIMFTTYFVYYNEKVKFLPITFNPRQAGINTINVKRIIKIGWKALGDFCTFKGNMKK